MNENETIEILTSLLNDNNWCGSIPEALTIAIKALDNQLKVKEILNTPTLFAEKFDRICELNKIFDDSLN